MPSYRLSQHSMDVVFKLEAQQLGSALARRFGIDLPPIVRYFPTDLPVADVHLEQLDSVFELADGSLLHLEFQTAHRRETLTRFLIYDAALYERFERHIHTVVIYGANVATAAARLSFGAVVEYRVENVLLGQQDGEATYQRLRAQVERGARLTPEERLDLIFLPLMRHQRAPREVVADTLVLAQRLPERQQRQALASLIGLGHRFLTEEELDALLEGLMSTNLGQRLLDRGYEQGLERGLEQGLERGLELNRQSLLRVLAKQFGPVPPAVGARLAQIDDLQQLEHLFDMALSADSLDDFVEALG